MTKRCPAPKLRWIQLVGWALLFTSQPQPLKSQEWTSGHEDSDSTETSSPPPQEEAPREEAPTTDANTDEEEPSSDAPPAESDIEVEVFDYDGNQAPPAADSLDESPNSAPDAQDAGDPNAIPPEDEQWRQQERPTPLPQSELEKITVLFPDWVDDPFALQFQPVLGFGSESFDTPYGRLKDTTLEVGLAGKIHSIAIKPGNPGIRLSIFGGIAIGEIYSERNSSRSQQSYDRSWAGMTLAVYRKMLRHQLEVEKSRITYGKYSGRNIHAAKANLRLRPDDLPFPLRARNSFIIIWLP